MNSESVKFNASINLNAKEKCHKFVVESIDSKEMRFRGETRMHKKKETKLNAVESIMNITTFLK